MTTSSFIASWKLHAVSASTAKEGGRLLFLGPDHGAHALRAQVVFLDGEGAVAFGGNVQVALVARELAEALELDEVVEVAEAAALVAELVELDELVQVADAAGVVGRLRGGDGLAGGAVAAREAVADLKHAVVDEGDALRDLCARDNGGGQLEGLGIVGESEGLEGELGDKVEKSNEEVDARAAREGDPRVLHIVLESGEKTRGEGYDAVALALELPSKVSHISA